MVLEGLGLGLSVRGLELRLLKLSARICCFCLLLEEARKTGLIQRP